MATTTGEATNNNVASGDFSHSEGSDNIASGNYSHAEGNNCVAAGTNSHAEGNATSALDDGCHSEGAFTTAGVGDGSGFRSHAEGDGSQATGVASHAEGSGCIASDHNAHAEGFTTQASANAAHSQGVGCIANADASDAMGAGAVTSVECEAAHSGGVLPGLLGTTAINQKRVIIVRGSTPGLALGETCVLKTGVLAGTPIVDIDLGLSPSNTPAYMINLRVVASKMATGVGAARQTACYNIQALASISSTGVMTLSATTVIAAAILQGGAFVGATLTLGVSGTILTITFAIAGGSTIASHVCGNLELLEVATTT